MKITGILIVGLSLFIARSFHLYVVRSWYVPDEFWQSLEVAHRAAFGIGYHTWEWTVGIRSYLSVSWIIILYKTLKLFSLDNLQILIWSPRFLQTLFSTYSDYCFVSWLKKRSKCSDVYWPVVCYVTCPFFAYCSTRTLVNTLETNLTTIALYHYPWSLRNKDVKFLWIVSLVCIVRPTAAIVWLPLIIYDFFAHKRYTATDLTNYISIGLVSILFSIIVDSYFYGFFVVTQWNFLYFNIIKKVNAHYSIEPWYWYYICGLPSVLGPIFLIFLYTFIKKLKHIKLNDIDSKLTITILWTLFVFGMIDHKEQRFMLPLCPMIFFVTSKPIAAICKKFKKLASLTIILNTLALIYLGRYHQIGATRVMSYLATVPQNSTLLFLMPCHSTPLYSHLHSNVTTRFLTCEPNLHGMSNYTDEADVFFENPQKWLEDSYTSKHNTKLPSHVIMYDVLSNELQTFLKNGKYKNILTIFHTDFPSGRIGQYINVFLNTDYYRNLSSSK